MKRHELLRHLRLYGCILKREGTRHPFTCYMNTANGVVESVPRHVEIDNRLARKICNRLKIPEPGQPSEN